MKNKAVLICLIATLGFSACQKSAAENAQTQLQSTPTPSEKLSVRKIDFKNYTYSDKTGKSIFTLKNGEQSFAQMKDIAFSLKNIEYADLTDDEEDEAIIHISIEYGAGSSGLLYIFTLENQKPKMLWYVESGYGAEGELKEVSAENDKLIVELFGNNRFNQDTGEFKFPNQKVIPKDLCYPTSFTRFSFKWNGEKFVIDGKPKLFNYDWKKENKNQ